MNRKLYLPLLLLVAFCSTINAQSQFPQQINAQLERFILENVQEKIYLQTNSNNYLADDTIWFKSTVVNAVTHSLVGNELLYYVDLISPENKVVHHQVYVFENGCSDSYLPLNGKFSVGSYKMLAYTNYMRNFPNEFLFQKTINIVPNKMEQTDWEFRSRVVPFANGDSVFVTFYSHSSNGREVNEPVDVQVRLAHGTILGEKCPVTNNEGRFSFVVPDSLKLPNALLTVRQSNQDNQSKYRISLSIQKPDLQFLPEGGELVSGQRNRVAFRCVDPDGKPVPIQGQISDSQGQTVALFSSNYRGMGSTLLTPLTGQQYAAQINYQDSVFKYDLPEAKANAFGLQLLEQTSDSIRLSIMKNSAGKASYMLVAHCRGNMRYMISGTTGSNRAQVSIPTTDLPEGVITITLFVDQVPCAERLVFVNRNENIGFKILDQQGGENPGAPFKLKLKASRPDGSPLSGNFSVLAWNRQLEHAIDTLENIRNYLLFSSDLQGEVLSNTDVFNTTDPEYQDKRDLLLLTHGWRRFTWEDVTCYTGEPKNYLMEQGLYLEGQVYRKLNDNPAPKNLEVTILLKGEITNYADKTRTDENGRFRFNLPAFTDSVILTIQTKNRLKKQSDYRIDIHSNLEDKRLDAYSFDRVQSSGYAPLAVNLSMSNQMEPENGKEKPTAVTGNIKLRKPRVNNYYFPGKDTFMIEEVEARSHYLNQRDSIIDIVGQPDVVIESAQLKKLTEERPWYSSLWDLLTNRVPGLQIFKTPYLIGSEVSYNLVIADDNVKSSAKIDTNLVGGQAYTGKNTWEIFQTPFIYKKMTQPVLCFRVNGNPEGCLYIFVDNMCLNVCSFPIYDFLSHMDPSDIESINFIAKPKNVDIAALLGISLPAIQENLIPTVGKLGSITDCPYITATDINLMDKLRNDMQSRVFSRVAAPPSLLYITTKSKGGIFYPFATKGIQSMYLKGLTAKREFYVPKYDSCATANTAMALRKTVFWEPQLQTDTCGIAEISFAPGVDLNNIGLQIQGVSMQGESGSKTFSFNKPQQISEPEQLVASTENMPLQTTEAINSYENLRLYFGQISDAETGKPIVFADITQSEPYYHECTNSEGGFFLAPDRLQKNRSIRISGPGYMAQELTVPENRNTPLNVYLKKATVQPVDPSRKTLEIVRNAIRESRKLYASDDCFQGYNREAVSIDGDTYGIYEMAFNYSNTGYAGVPSAIRFETVKFKNMEDKSGHKLMMLKPNHRDVFYPLKTDLLSVPSMFWQPDNLKLFNFEQIGRVEYDGEQCYKIRFSPNESSVLPLQSGVLYIGTQSGALRYAAWSTDPAKRQYLSYTTYLQSNPMEYDISIEDDYNEASYTLQNGQLYLQGTNRQIRILVNGQNRLKFENRLSVVGTSARNYKDIKTRNADTLIEDQKSKHMLVKDAMYQVEPWINTGFVKPEEKLIHDAGFLHDITENQ